ncbi:hypothetical protein BJ322DRAFT_1022987 [Thelephora terrestris]|uniref:WD40 repeat-like protein n=1 Tax=Thelephora terrestris TaxID=56493 RepID=A0A9P6HB67_9AGAM|nr:hypothetical protein BJ322DRAFT_1022987 [Thelephora terrestris]
MVHYELTFTVPSPGSCTAFVEFSPSGRFLAVGDRDSSLLYILDRRAGFHPNLSVVAPTKPTALVWETPQTFYVGLGDGRFIHYRIDLKGMKVVAGVANHMFRGAFPITAMALDTKSKTLVLSVGPGVFAFRRVRTTSIFRLLMVWTSALTFLKPFQLFKRPWKSGATLPEVYLFHCQQYTRRYIFPPTHNVVATSPSANRSTVLEFDGDSRLHSSFQTARIDCTGLPVLKAITSASEEEVHQLNRCWIYGDNHMSPFLFINGGAATLSSSTTGAAIIRDTVTQREIQSLEHTGTTDHHVTAMSYHVSTGRYSVVTADCGKNAKIKVWTAQRPSSHPQGKNYGLAARKGLIAVVLVVASIIIMQDQMGRILNEVLWVFSHATMMLARMCINIGYLIHGVAEDVATGNKLRDESWQAVVIQLRSIPG